MIEKNDNWSTLVTYSWLSDAQVTRSMLEAHDIPTMVPEENTAGLTPLLTGMQVRILVREVDLEKAKELLNAVAIENEKTTGDAPKTKSNFFRALIGALFNVPMRRK